MCKKTCNTAAALAACQRDLADRDATLSARALEISKLSAAIGKGAEIQEFQRSRIADRDTLIADLRAEAESRDLLASFATRLTFVDCRIIAENPEKFSEVSRKAAQDLADLESDSLTQDLNCEAGNWLMSKIPDMGMIEMACFAASLARYFDGADAEAQAQAIRSGVKAARADLVMAGMLGGDFSIEAAVCDEIDALLADGAATSRELAGRLLVLVGKSVNYIVEGV